MKDSIELTEMPVNYTGGFDRLEVMSWTPDVHDKPGLYLQRVEGCGYLVFEMTPDQAEKLGNILLKKAKETRKAFESKKHVGSK